MSYERMCKAEQELEQEVKRLLEQAEKVDGAEEQEYGQGKRGDELPAELARRESRLVKIRQAKAELEEEARQRAEQAAAGAQAKIAERRLKEQQTGKKAMGREPTVVDPQRAVPEPKAQRNFTDADSRIMKDGATGGFVQGVLVYRVSRHRRVRYWGEGWHRVAVGRVGAAAGRRFVLGSRVLCGEDPFFLCR